MKKIIPFLLCGCVAFGVASCSKDDEAIEKSTASEKLVNMSFFSKNDEAATRTALSSDGSSVVWTANDVLGIGFQGSSRNATQPFKTSMNGNVARFYGQAADKTTPYYAIYPYQATGKIEYKSTTQAVFSYTLSNKQTAIANTFDPKANPSVALIPKAEDTFKAYNLGGLLKFTFKGSANVKQVTLLSINQEPLSGSFESTVTFDSNKAISTLSNKVVSGSPVITYKPESGLFAEQTAYYVALPATTLEQGLTLAFVLNNGKAVQYKVRSAVDIKRGEVKDLGLITINESKAKDFILKNQGLIDAVAKSVSGLVRDANGNLDVYSADNLEKILSYKGHLGISNQDNLTSIDELQYYRNVTGITLDKNKNLAGKLDFSKYPQLVGSIIVQNSPLVTSIDVTGLDKITTFSATSMKNMTDVTIKGNSKLQTVSLHHNESLQAVDVRDLPELRLVETYYSKSVTTIKTAGSPKLTAINATSSGSLSSIPGLNENTQLVDFVAPYTPLESLDFSNQPNLRSVNLLSAKVKELKGLAASGTNLKNLQLSNTQLSSLDVSNNTELLELELYSSKITKLDVTANKKLKRLRIPFNPLEELVLGDNTALEYLDISHDRLSTLDITKLTALKKVYAGRQTQKANPGILQSMTVYYTAAQKTVLDPVIAGSKDPSKVNYAETNADATYVVKN